MVSILVLNWNGEHYLRQCLNGLVQDACQHIEIVLVDNGSNDRSVALTANVFPRVRIIANPTNLGFSGGYNAAAPHARGRVLVLLNNDILVREGWIDPLIEPLLNDPKVGITTSKVLFLGTRILNSAGGYLKLWTGGGELGFGRDEASLPVDRIIEPFYASGAAMAIRKEVFERLGGFDSAMFAYGEDLDLSWRARLAGYKIRYVPGSVVYHHFSGTLGGFSPQKVRMVTHHHLRAMGKCLSAFSLLHSLPAYIMFALSKGIALTVIKRDFAYLVSVVSAVGDAIRGVGELRKQRQATRMHKMLPDRMALRSEGFGLMTSPWEFWRVLRVAEEIAKHRAEAEVETTYRSRA